MVVIAALYRFARFADPEAIRPPLLALCTQHGVRGTLLLAREGVNGTIAGSQAAIDAVLAQLRTLPDCAALEAKFSTAPAMPFHRMKVRLKREIVTMGVPDIDPLASAGTYVAPADWNALIADPDTVTIDTRNDYEVRIGSFEGAIDPKTKAFSDFPAWFDAHRAEFTGKKIAMFCTGGIRCEKATAYVKAQGLDNVYHLQGGILKYIEDMPAQGSRWRGECFVFDERVAVGHGLAPGTHALCRACRLPLTPADQASPLFEAGISCPACHGSRSAEQRAGYAERHRQVMLAQGRGEAHIGAAPGDDATR